MHYLVWRPSRRIHILKAFFQYCLIRSGIQSRWTSNEDFAAISNWIYYRIGYCSSYTGSEKSISYRRYVRRPDGHRFDPKYLMKNVRYCSKSVLIWGVIKGDGSRILIRCPTRLDSTAYQEVLNECLQDMYADDGASCHTSRSTMSYLDNKKICLSD